MQLKEWIKTLDRWIGEHDPSGLKLGIAFIKTAIEKTGCGNVWDIPYIKYRRSLSKGD
jgi:hypothetical protein